MQGYFGNLFLIQFKWQPQFCFPLQVFPPFSDCSNIPQQPLKSFTSNKAFIKAGGFSPILWPQAQHNFQKFKFRREILEFRGKILNLSKKTFSLDNVSSKRFQAITNQIQEILMRYQAECSKCSICHLWLCHYLSPFSPQPESILQSRNTERNMY